MNQQKTRGHRPRLQKTRNFIHHFYGASVYKGQP
jgi:hypothetical protein